MISAEHWPLALPIDTYVGQLWRKHRKRFMQNLDRTTIPPSIRERFAGMTLHLLVLTEPYCEDSTQLVPVVWRLAQEVDGLELRLLRQSEQPELAVRFLADAGHPAIPVFILLDDQLDELGALVERPPRVTAEMIAETRRFQDAHPDLRGIRRSYDRMPEETRAVVKQHIAGWRDTQHELWTCCLLDDLAAIAENRTTKASLLQVGERLTEYTP